MANHSTYEFIPGFGERLHELMRQKRKTAKDVARAVGRERKSIYGWIHNDNVPSAVAMMNLAEYLGTTVNFLIYGKDEVNRNDNKRSNRSP